MHRSDPSFPRRSTSRPDREEPRSERLQARLLALHPGLGGADGRTTRPLRADPRRGRAAVPLPLLDAVGLDRTDRRARGLLPQPAQGAARPDAARTRGGPTWRRADARTEG